MAAMLQQQQMAPLGQFNTGSTAPPAYTATPSQPMPQGAVPQQNVSFQGHPQVMSPPQMQQQFQPQPQQQQQQQGQFVQNPQTQQPMAQGPPPLQFPPSMTPQQQQQVQQIIQNMPPDKVQMYQQQAQQMVNQQGQPQQFQQPALGQNYAVTPAQGPNGPQNPPGSHGTPAGPKDEKQTGKVQRFLGDTLFGRVGRASVQTVTSALKMPASLSPWGDNNPVTLPNVRYRDAVLFTTFAFVGAPLVDGISDGITGAFGADSFVSEIVSQGAATINGSTIIKYSVFQIVEQAIDKGILEHMLPEEEKMLQTTDVKSLQVGIKHKLMGVDADLRFVGIYPNNDLQACEKGWFCPYLFASARTPQIPRANNFSICQFFGPFLGGTFPHSIFARL